MGCSTWYSIINCGKVRYPSNPHQRHHSKGILQYFDEAVEGGYRMKASLNELILVLAKADGQPWGNLVDAPSSARFMGYPEMAQAVIDYLELDEEEE